MLGLLIKRADMSSGVGSGHGSLAKTDREDIITRNEGVAGWAFDWKGGKVKETSKAEAEAEFDRKMEKLRVK